MPASPALPSWMVAPAPTSDALSTAPMELAERCQLADVVIELTLRPLDGPAPAWGPGAHIDLHLPGSLVRQYSLCGEPSDRDSLRIAVLRERDGRGGSVHLHDRAAVGDVFEVGGPRNNFRLVDAPRYLFIAGGIGITALMPMLEHVRACGLEWDLHYLGRSQSTMAYLNALPLSDPRVTVVAADAARNRWNPGAVLTDVRPGTAIYCCGPERLLNAVEAAAAHWPSGSLHVERFKPRPSEGPQPRAFDVELRRSGRVLHVPAEVSVLDVVEEAGILVPSSCREGTCGTCEVMVLEGDPEHRDSVLSAEERAVGDCLMVCVSRASTDRLVIDL
jgi:ferredoxin-NADP reductase